MLFPYKYIPHSIEKLQRYIDFLFLEVWCNAEGDYDIEKLNGCPDLKEIVLAISRDDRITIDHLYGPIKDIFSTFKTLNRKKRKRLRKWYAANNSIEKLCSNERGYRGKHYKELDAFHAELSKKLSTFFKNLWERVLDLKAIRSKIGNIRDHYTAFMTENDEETCPFCGLQDLKGVFLSKRDAYDHYLPKHVYAFNSINFKNLAPMCHACNSSYKLQRDPLYTVSSKTPLRLKEQRRRKAFYPYSNEATDISVSIRLTAQDIRQITPDDIELTLSSPDHQEELETWMDIFGIEERFKEKCCKKSVGKYWYLQVADEFANAQIDGLNVLQKIYRDAQKSPYAERNFLKKAFLEACERAGIFGNCSTMD